MTSGLKTRIMNPWQNSSLTTLAKLLEVGVRSIEMRSTQLMMSKVRHISHRILSG